MFSRYEFKKASFQLVGNKEGFTINFDGDIFDKNLKRVETFIDSEGYPSVTLEGYLGLQDYRIADLMVIQFKRIHLPQDQLNEIIAFNADGDKLNLQAKNIGYRFKSGKVEHHEYSGFYYVPGFTRYLVDTSGTVKRHDTGQTISTYVTKGGGKKNITGGYVISNVSAFNSRTCVLSRHRALALTFMTWPDNVDDLVVNHKDGVPGNDILDNLEWATRGDNNKHAREAGLRTQQISITARNVFTGEVTTYYSMAECERALNVYWDTLIRRLSDDSRFGEVLPCGYQVKYSDNLSEFPEVSNPDDAVKDAVQRIEIQSLNCETKEILTHDSIGAAAKTLGLCDSSISWKLTKGNGKPLKGYHFRLRPDEEFPESTAEEIKESKVPTNKVVFAHNLLDGSEIYFASISSAVKWYGVDFSESLRNGNQPIFEDGWRFRIDSEWEEILDEDVEGILYRLRKGVQSYNVETGAIMFFQSANAAAKHFGGDSKHLRRVAFSRGVKIYKGQRFRLGTDLMEPWPTND